MITGKGAGVLTAAIAIYVLARLSQVGWLYLVDAVLWGALLLALVMPWAGAVFIAARRNVFPANKRQAGERVSEGDQVNITISLENRLFYPRFFHSVIFDSTLAGPDMAEQRFFVAHLPASGVLELESTVEAYQRGLHELGPVILESSAPFGLFRRRRALSGPQPLLVLPRVYPLKRLALVDNSDGRSTKTRISNSGLDLAGSRPYVQGDSRRMVHWRNTARAGRLMVKETEDQTDRTLHIIFDSSDVWGEGRDTTFEYAIKLAVAVADYALKNEVPVQVWGSHLFGASVTTAGSPVALGSVTLTWTELLESLAVARPEGREATEQGLASLPEGANLFIALSTGGGGLDHEGLDRAIARSGASVVVRLEGFGGRAGIGDNGRSPQWGGASILSCKPGGLAQTLSEIERLGQRGVHESATAPGGRTPVGAGRP